MGGVTPLMKAAESGDNTCVEYILSLGGNQFIVDNRGRTAYDYARSNLAPNHKNVIRLQQAMQVIIQQGANLETKYEKL